MQYKLQSYIVQEKQVYLANAKIYKITITDITETSLYIEYEAGYGKRILKDDFQRMFKVIEEIPILYYQRQLPYYQITPEPSYADMCPCNPKNGGSGVCNCILGGMKITY